MNLTIIQRKDYADKKGRRTLLIRYFNNGKPVYFRTGVKVTSDEWNGEEVINHEQAKYFNQLLRKKLTEYETKSLQSQITGSHFDPLGKVNTDLIKYCQDCLKEWKDSKKSETLRQCTSEINKLKAFNHPSLSQVNLTWLNKYREHLYEIGNKTNTVWKSMKFLRMIIRKAHREKLIESNPFELFKMPVYKEPEKNYLSKEQINLIEKEGSFISTWFVISCLTGLRFGDLQTFDKKKIKNGRLIVYTQKTGQIVSLPFTERLKALFERIEYKPLSYTNVHANRLLKATLSKLEIDGSYSWHSSRHSAAMTWANAGISIEVTAKLLGHQNLKSSHTYYKISNDRIDNELKKLGDK